jgi:hypothetical protein
MPPVRVTSQPDYAEDIYVGDLVPAILDGVNECESPASGADVSYKMAAKAANGGANGQTPLGSRNVREKVDGRAGELAGTAGYLLEAGMLKRARRAVWWIAWVRDRDGGWVGDAITKGSACRRASRRLRDRRS